MTFRKNDNILLVANFESDVGFAWWLMENFWSEISLYFIKSNITSTLIYPKINCVPDVVATSPIEIVEHDFSKRDFYSIIKLVRLIRQKRIGYVYLTDRAYYDWLYLVLRLSGVRKIVNHDHMPGERTKLPFYKRFVKKIIHSAQKFSCDHYIGVSNFVVRRAINTACVPENKCSCIHNGIKLFNDTKTTYVHDAFKIPIDSTIIVTTGRASFYKGIDKLIKCAHVLIHEKGIENLYFLHVGSGPDLEKFKEIAVELGVQDKFIFAGFRQDVSKILPCCDIGIQVSLGEAFSLSIIEYMCAGLATLAPNNCGNAEAIEDGVTGFLFAPGDINDIVKKVLSVLNNYELLRNIKEASRKSVLDKFSINKCNENLISLLDKQFTQ